MTISDFDAVDAGQFDLIEAGDGVVAVAGELDAATADQLVRRLSAPPAVQVIDLSGVTFIDASGVRALVDATVCDGSNRRLLRVSVPGRRSDLRDHRADLDCCTHLRDAGRVRYAESRTWSRARHVDAE